MGQSHTHCTHKTIKKNHPTMDSLKGAKLVKADGSSVEADSALEGKDLILFYFSAHWCPPCRQFTPMLKDFYEEVDNVEIVFVSSDRSNEDMLSYMKESHGDWLATEHGSSLTNDLKQKFGIQGIPPWWWSSQMGRWSPRTDGLTSAASSRNRPWRAGRTDSVCTFIDRKLSSLKQIFSILKISLEIQCIYLQ